MIVLYVSSKKLKAENRDIKVKISMPAEESNLWLAMQKCEAACVDDCRLTEISCENPYITQFLKTLKLDGNDIFELNVFSQKIENMSKAETKTYAMLLKAKKVKSLKKAVYELE